MRIAIVEDEAMVARRLERMVRDLIDAPVTVDVAPSLAAARALIADRTFDLLFLDLNLNGKDGFALLEHAAAAPFPTIIVSAHHDQALRAFEYGVSDFLAKPWSEERLRKALDRVVGRDATNRGRTRWLAVRRGRDVMTVPVESIVHVRGADDYSQLHLEDGAVHLHEKTLTALESLLPDTFLRVHRSYIVNMSRVRATRVSALVLDEGTVIPIGRVYRAAVRERVGG